MERLIQAARGDGVNGLEGSKCFEESEEREESARLGGKFFTWPVFGTN